VGSGVSRSQVQCGGRFLNRAFREFYMFVFCIHFLFISFICVITNLIHSAATKINAPLAAAVFLIW